LTYLQISRLILIHRHKHQDQRRSSD